MCSIAAVVCCLGSVLALPCIAQTVRQPTIEQQQSLEKFLRDYLGTPYPPFEKERPTRYSAAFVDLGNDGKEQVIVYVTGRAWCGSGGCITLILGTTKSSFRVITRLTITWPPIRVLTTESHGWHDVGVWMQGGGIQPGYEADLYFNGKTYVGRDKATLRPSELLRERRLPGKVAISSSASETGKPLYP